MFIVVSYYNNCVVLYVYILIHDMHRRYAEFAASMLILQNSSDGLGVGGGGEGMLANDMMQIRTEVIGKHSSAKLP